MEPLEVADHLRSSLIDRLRELVASEKTAAAAPSPPPPPRIPDMSPAEKQARWRRAIPVVYKVAESLYGKRQGVAEKIAQALVAESFVQAASDLRDWAPRSHAAVGEALRQAGVKTAENAGEVSADYVGRLFAHGLLARRIEKQAGDEGSEWWRQYGFLTDPTDKSQITGTEGVETTARQPWSVGDVVGYPQTPGEPPVPELRGKTQPAT